MSIHTDSKIIDALGGTTKVAEIFGIEPPSVSEWRKRGIPKSRKQTLALMFPGEVPASWAPTPNIAERPAA